MNYFLKFPSVITDELIDLNGLQEAYCSYFKTVSLPCEMIFILGLSFKQMISAKPCGI